MKTGNNIKVIRHTACIVVNPITVNNFASFFGCTQIGPQTLRRLGLKDFEVSRLVPGALALVGPIGIQLLVYFYFLLSSHHLCFISVFVGCLFSRRYCTDE